MTFANFFLPCFNKIYFKMEYVVISNLVQRRTFLHVYSIERSKFLQQKILEKVFTGSESRDCCFLLYIWQQWRGIKQYNATMLVSCVRACLCLRDLFRLSRFQFVVYHRIENNSGPYCNSRVDYQLHGPYTIQFPLQQFIVISFQTI